MRVMIVLLALLVLTAPSFAQEMLADPAQEARAVALGRDIRCVVCAGQSIEDSNADMAANMRALVREKVMAGESDEAIMAYLRDRYGDDVLMRPPVATRTFVLWLAPIAAFALGGLVLARIFKRAQGKGA